MDCCQRFHHPEPFDPFRVGKVNGGTPVGGGHKNRALAHGYSISTPSGLRCAQQVAIIRLPVIRLLPPKLKEEVWIVFQIS